MGFENFGSMPSDKFRIRVLFGSHGNTDALAMVPQKYLIKLPGAMYSF